MNMVHEYSNAKLNVIWPQCVRVYYYIVKLEEPYATFVTDNN